MFFESFVEQIGTYPVPATDKLKTKEIVIGLSLIVVFAIGMMLVLRSYRNEGEQRSAVISEEGEKDPDHIEAFVKLLGVDPVKGDATARIEFIPHGAFANADGTLTQNLKLYTNSAGGKQEHDFQKGKRMNPVEATINLYDGSVTDYPFDKHNGFLELYLTRPATATTTGPAKASAEATPPAERAEATPNTSPETRAEPTAAGSTNTGEGEKPTTAAKKPEETAASADEDVSIAVDFYGSIAGFKIEAAKSPESEADYVGIDVKIARSSTVVFFSLFVIGLMWGVTIAVLFMTLSIALRGRKIELAMFSFLAALLFAFAAVRNSQPGVPPIGAFSDYISFFWAEIILALCLLAMIFMWLFRPAAK